MSRTHANANSPRHPVVELIDSSIRWVSEISAAVLVLLEIVVLLAGVVARYVFNAPLTWSDELASVLFLWLAMLGAVIALRRGEHMRLTTLVNRLPAVPRAWVELLARLVVITFVVEIIFPALEYFQDQWDIVTPRAGTPRWLAGRRHWSGCRDDATHCVAAAGYLGAVASNHHR